MVYISVTTEAGVVGSFRSSHFKRTTELKAEVREGVDCLVARVLERALIGPVCADALLGLPKGEMVTIQERDQHDRLRRCTAEWRGIREIDGMFSASYLIEPGGMRRSTEEF